MTKHIDDTTLSSIARDPAHATAKVDEHLRACRRCRAMASFLRDSRERSQAGDCPAADALLQFVDAPANPALTPIDTHLSQCLDCALEVGGLRSMAADLQSLPGASDLAPSRPSLLEQLRALAQPQTPLQLALSLRAPAATATNANVAAGMAAYRRGQHREARRLLTRARKEGERSAGLSLYLGACELATGRTRAACEALADAVRQRPRSGAIRWQLAQALLLAGDAERALEELRRAARLGGARGTHARVLAERVRRALAKPPERLTQPTKKRPKIVTPRAKRETMRPSRRQREK